MIHVRRHRRQTASGQTVNVRAHERAGYDGTVPVPEWSRPARLGDTVATSPQVTEDWWADDDEAGDEVAERAGSRTLAARARLREARAALAENARQEAAAGITHETDEFHRLNREVGEAMQAVPVLLDDPSEWRDRIKYRRKDREDAAEAAAEVSPAFAALVARNPSLGGESFRRLKALRDSGYTGPVDQDGNKVIADTGISVVPEEPLPEWRNPW